MFKSAEEFRECLRSSEAALEWPFTAQLAAALVVMLRRSFDERDPMGAPLLLELAQPLDETRRSNDEFREWAVAAAALDRDVE